MANEIPSQEYLRECFTYDSETGLLLWNERPSSHFSDKSGCQRWNSRNAGKEAIRSVTAQGYYRGAINNKNVLAHRIVWKMIHGVDAISIDHIDGNGLNNRLNNLRSVSHSENMRNQRLRADNKSGVPGVYFVRRVGLWACKIQANGKVHSLGYFKTLDEALQKRRSSIVGLGFHENHGAPRAERMGDNG